MFIGLVTGPSTAGTPGLVAALVAGMLSFLSPCVLPLVPGYLSLMTGLSMPTLEMPAAADRRRLAGLSLLFVLGFSVVFVAYGAAASSLGSVVLAHREVLTQVAGVLVVMMGLVVAGLLRPAALLQERRFQVPVARLGPYAAPVMGMAFAFGWTPCIGPVLAGVLTLAATRSTLTSGVELLAMYSLGLGLPFVAMGLAFGRLRGTWVWCKRHGRGIDLVAGGLLVIFGALLLTSGLGRMSSGVSWLWNQVGLSRLTVG